MSDLPERPLRKSWAAPTLFALPVFAQESETDRMARGSAKINAREPSAPAAAGGKLGLSIEMAFPLAARSDS